MKPPLIAALLAMSLCLLTGCGVIGLDRHMRGAAHRGTVRVHAVPDKENAGNSLIVVALFSRDGSTWETAGGRTLRTDGFGSLELDEGKQYEIVVFSDLDSDGRMDFGEPFDRKSGVKPSSFIGSHAGDTLKFQPEHRPSGFPRFEVRLPEDRRSGRNVAVGDLASLDDPRFVEQTGWGGLWRPFTALRENTYGIYVTETYDPARVPVILVSGIGGSPSEWTYLSRELDLTRYQLWFFHYPSGVRLEKASSGLAEAVRVMQGKHAFGHCVLMAHSMGGLVARAACADLVRTGDAKRVSRLITLSTPWGGHSAAESGVRFLSRPVLSWKDVVPESAFLRSLYHAPWPPSIRHDVIYGEKSASRAWLDGPNDGVVTVASQRDPRVLSHASSDAELGLGHMEILNSPDTARLLRKRMDGR